MSRGFKQPCLSSDFTTYSVISGAWERAHTHTAKVQLLCFPSLHSQQSFLPMGLPNESLTRGPAPGQDLLLQKGKRALKEVLCLKWIFSQALHEVGPWRKCVHLSSLILGAFPEDFIRIQESGKGKNSQKVLEEACPSFPSNQLQPFHFLGVSVLPVAMSLPCGC